MTAAVGTTVAAQPPSMKNKRSRRSKAGWAAIALAPFALFCLAIGAYPLVRVLQMALTEVDITGTGFHFTWTGLTNLQTVLGDGAAWQALWNTLVFVLATVVGSLIAGLVAALLVDRAVTLLPIARNVMIWPAVIAPVVVSLIWLLILSPTAGGLNKVLASIGIPEQSWLNTEFGAMASVVVVDIWHWSPIVFLFMYTALKGIGEEILEAARVDGASEGAILRRIVLPLLLPSIAAVALVRVVMGVKAFDEMYLLTAGGPNGATTLVSQRIQLWFFHDLKYGEAAAFSIVVIGITVALLLVAVAARRAGQRA